MDLEDEDLRDLPVGISTGDERQQRTQVLVKLVEPLVVAMAAARVVVTGPVHLSPPAVYGSRTPLRQS
jgi:hypothetical protein